MFIGHRKWAVEPLLLLAVLHPQPTPLKSILQLVQPLPVFLQVLFQQQVMNPFCFFSLFLLGPCLRQQGICTRLAQGPAPYLGPRASALELGGLAEMLQAPRLHPCERGNIPAADAAACTAAAMAGVAGVAVAAPPAGTVIFGVGAIVDTADFGLFGGGLWCRGIASRYSPGSGSRFCRWRLARCG